MLGYDSDRIVADEGRPAGDHLVKHAPQRIEIANRARLAAHRLLRRHVASRAHHHPGHGEATAVQRDGEPEVTDLRRAVLAQPDIPGLEVAVDNPACVRVLQCLGYLVGHAQRLPEGQAVVSGLLQQAGQISSRHVLRDDVRLRAPAQIVLFADVEDGDDVRMVAEATHGLCLPAHACKTGLVQTLGLDQRKRYVAVQLRVMRQVNSLARTLAQETLDLVSPRGERGGQVDGWLRGRSARDRLGSRRRRGRGRAAGAARIAEAGAGSQLSAATAAARLQGRAARVAKSGVFAVLVVTGLTEHFSPGAVE